jgi:Xaa-Pro aminopeptidase
MQDIFKTYSQVFLSEGLGSKAPLFYAKRRQAHIKNLDSLGIYASKSTDFLYLTGINQSGAILALDPFSKKEVLFLKEKDAKKEFWNGIRLGLPDRNAKKITGFKTILPLKNFKPWLKERILKLKTEHIYSNKTMRCKLKVKDISKINIAQRIVLEPERIALAKKAQAIARNAFLGILKNISSYKNERVLSADLECLMLRQTGNGLAFPSIVAAGKNACTLHYMKKDCEIENGNLILLDFGCRYNTVCSDISRTIPASEKFNPLQALLYNIVLDTQKFHEKNVKPGITLKELGKKAWDYLEELLAIRFTSKGGVAKRSYIIRPHGISHLIGDIVHEGD